MTLSVLVRITYSLACCKANLLFYNTYNFQNRGLSICCLIQSSFTSDQTFGQFLTTVIVDQQNMGNHSWCGSWPFSQHSRWLCCLLSLMMTRLCSPKMCLLLTNHVDFRKGLNHKFNLTNFLAKIMRCSSILSPTWTWTTSHSNIQIFQI